MRKYRISLTPKELQLLNKIVEQHYDDFFGKRPLTVKWGKPKITMANEEQDEHLEIIDEISNKVLRVCKRANISYII